MKLKIALAASLLASSAAFAAPPLTGAVNYGTYEFAASVSQGSFSQDFTFTLSPSLAAGAGVGTGAGYSISGSYPNLSLTQSTFDYGVTLFEDGVQKTHDDHVADGFNLGLLTTGHNYKLTFAGNSTGAVANQIFGAVQISAVPEPETYAMMLAGLGALGFMARRRQAK